VPPTRSTTDDRTPRRRVLAGLGTALAAAVAGCGGRVPGGAATLDAETTVEADPDPRVHWQYPPRDGDRAGIGYAAVEAVRARRREGGRPTLRLAFNSTVGGIAADEPYRGYRAERFRFRVWPPSTDEGRSTYSVRVEPPSGQWDDFGVSYDLRGGIRRTTIELRSIDTQGTIVVPAVFVPSTAALPEQLHCSFTVRASRPGVLGKTVRITDRGSLPIGAE
jgi:hypothetical protein